MKNYLFLCLLSVFTLGSCSEDDDATSANDDIVGTWVLVETSFPSINLEACTEPSVITFNGDNTGSATFYLEQSDCEPETSEGEWHNQNSVYQIEIPVVGNLTGTVTFEGADTFIFRPEIEIAPGSSFTFERQ